MTAYVAEGVDRIRREGPLVHNVTNLVAMTLSANVLIAAGASPIMSAAPEEAGDLAGARILFQRAAEAGDATAATALGATYDPTVLAKLGAVGIGADLERARFWYQKAASLGSTDARRRLDLLANR